MAGVELEFDARTAVAALGPRLRGAERQVVVEENEALMRELGVLQEQVAGVETELAGVAALATEFAAHVLEQNRELESVYDSTVSATQHVRSGNESLRKALRKQGGFRVVVLAIIVICSLMLLFLNEY